MQFVDKRKWKIINGNVFSYSKCCSYLLKGLIPFTERMNVLLFCNKMLTLYKVLIMHGELYVETKFSSMNEF